MKQVLLLLGFLLIGFSSSAQTAPEKHALIIAIGNYEPQTGWDSISSLNDVPLISAALESQGFMDTVVLRDAEATKDGIVEALQDLAGRVSPGDIVVVHISSHGQQIEDQKFGDEVDRLDEAIVAWGAPATASDPSYRGENHLRDEDLGKELNAIRSALGPDGDLLLIVDACHSGTATRGPRAEEVSRGTDKPLIFSENWERGDDDGQVDMFEESKVSTRGNEALSPMVVFSAAQAHEVNFEYKGAGSLSVAFNRAMKQLDTNYTYRLLFDQIVKEMSVIASNQTPAMEGDVDRKLFGGELVYQEPYFKVRNLDGTSMSLEGGAIAGLNKGTLIKVYDRGTTSDTAGVLLASGEIKRSDLYYSRAELDKPLDGKAEDYWVFVDQMALGDVAVRVSLDKIGDPILKRRAQKMLADSRIGEESDSAVDFYLERDANMDLQLVRGSDGKVFRDELSDEGELEDVSDAILSYAKGRFLKGLEFQNPKYKVEMELVPVRDINGDLMVDSARLAEVRKNGYTTFTSEDSAAIRIVNRGTRKMYFNIIYIDELGEPYAFIPDPSRMESGKDFRLDKNQDMLLTDYVIEFGEPFGVTETLKVFASSKPLDLTAITGGTRGPKDDNPVEVLFADGKEMGTRGPKASTFGSKTKAGTFTFIFDVIE